MIRYGKPVLNLKYNTVKFITFGTVVSNICILIISLSMFVSAINIKTNMGDYINMVSNNDGILLPLLLVVPALLCIPINSVSIYVLYKAFSKEKHAKVNTVMFALVLIKLASVLLMLIICVMVFSHAYSVKLSLHDGITEAMNNYNLNSLLKSKIDLLQIHFQCCGSKDYTEWYNIQWYDTHLMQKNFSIDKHRTPFSCCAMQSVQLCIHHGIESTASTYHYTRDLNFSISTNGCYTKIKEKEKFVGGQIVGNIMILLVFQVVVVVGLRFVQTAHFTNSCFEKEDETYLSWLFGKYVSKKTNDPPPPPPLPKELMD